MQSEPSFRATAIAPNAKTARQPQLLSKGRKSKQNTAVLEGLASSTNLMGAERPTLSCHWSAMTPDEKVPTVNVTHRGARHAYGTPESAFPTRSACNPSRNLHRWQAFRQN